MPVVACGILLLAFAPILITNYIADDMAFAIGFHNSDVGLWEFTSNVFKTWWFESGRITYLAWLAIRFSLGSIQNLLVYKTYLLMCNLLAVFAFVYMCSALGANRQQLILLILCFVATIQIRGSFDPYVSFHGLMPLCSLFVFLSIASYVKKMRILSIATFVIASLFYEIGYVVLPAILFLSYISCEKDIGRMFKDVFPYGATLLLMLLIGAAGKLYGQYALDIPVNAAYTSNVEWQKMIDVSAKQAIASLPLNYLFLTDRSGNSGVDIKTNKILWFSLLALVPLFPIFLYNVGKKFKFNQLLNFVGSAEDGNSWKNMAAVGLVFWLVPGILISVSPKYQDTVRWSQPYITNYLSAIGVSMLLFSAICFVSQKKFNINHDRLGLFVGLVVYVSIVTTAYNYYNAFLLREAWSGQDFVKAMVWENTDYKACSNKIYSNKWHYWEAKLFEEKYVVAERNMVDFVLADGDCAIIKINGYYKFYYPASKITLRNNY